MQRAEGGPRPDQEPPDLQSQLESLLDEVWKAEAEWRLDDRIALSLASERPRKGRRKEA